MRRTLTLAACALTLASAAEALSWSDFDGLVGEWHGTGTESLSTATVTQTWERFYGGKFLRLTTHAVWTREDGQTEVRENVGYLSYDNDRDAFVFRQFYTGGYVGVYDVLVSKNGRMIDFGERAAESTGEVRARMTIVFTGDDEYVHEIDLASRRAEFQTLQTLTMKR